MREAGNATQQKARHRRHDKAEQHLVDVPAQGVEPARQPKTERQHGGPQAEGRGAPGRGPQEERPEALRQPRRRLAGVAQGPPSPHPAVSPIRRAASTAPALCGSSRKPPRTRGASGRTFTTKSHAISSAPSAKTMSPGSLIHCQKRVVR